MLKKMMIYAIVMGAHIPLCASPNTTIVSKGDAYVINKYVTYAQLDSYGNEMWKKDGTLYIETELTSVELHPNTKIAMQEDPKACWTDIAIATKDGRTVLSRRPLLLNGRILVLQGTTCTIDGPRVANDEDLE